MSRTFSGLPQPAGLIQEGSLYSVTITSSRYDVRWATAELRTAELLSRIQPNESSEKRRKAVSEYVKKLIERCFDCQVFTFGSVPLKTYLPDGDIDLTAFSKHQSLKDTWAIHVQDILEHEELRKSAEFCVKEVQCIHAEVKIVKCLVENIVVDISFNQLGGLCTLCFLDEVDRLIERDHLFKRSIILVKAWCYYESRLLGAPHGLLSTYALETLVLYIFNVFHTSLRGPLEVLFMFLDYFSNFDWDKYCVSLWGPVPLESIPDLTAESPLRDGGKLLLSTDFLEACSDAYSVVPRGRDTQSRTFVGKYLNIVDPLRTNNNLGRSVNKASFFRIRRAFSLGARKMAKLFEASNQDFAKDLDSFFSSTWESHQNTSRRDAPDSSFPPFRPFNHSSQQLQVYLRNTSDDEERAENQEKCDKSQSAYKPGLQSGILQESSEVLASQHTTNTSIYFMDEEIEMQKSSQDVNSLDSTSCGEEVKSISTSLFRDENNKQHNKQANLRAEVFLSSVAGCQRQNLLLRTKSLGDNLPLEGELGESFWMHMRRSTSDGRLEGLSDSQAMTSSRLQLDAKDLAIEQMHSISDKEPTKNSGNVSSVVDGSGSLRKTDATRLGADGLTVLPMKAEIAKEDISMQLDCHHSFTENVTEKDVLESASTTTSKSRNGKLQRATAQNDSILSTTSRSQVLTTSRYDTQRLSELALSEPHDQFPASLSYMFSPLPYMSLSDTSTFTPSGFVEPKMPQEMSLGISNSTISDSQNQVFPEIPSVIVMQGPHGLVSSPFQSYLDLPAAAPTPPVLRNSEEIGEQSNFRHQDQEQLPQLRAQPWSYLNTSSSLSSSQEDAELDQYKMGVPSTTAAPQGSNALAKGRNTLKDSKVGMGKGVKREIKAAENSGSSRNVNTSSYKGLLESSGDTPQEPVNTISVSLMQTLPSYATVTVNKSNFGSPAVSSQSSNELTVPLIGGHYSTLSLPTVEISPAMENPSRWPAFSNNQAPGASSRYVAAGVSFPTFSYYSPFYITTQGLDHVFGSEVTSEVMSSYMPHDDDSSTITGGDQESNSAIPVSYGAGEKIKVGGTVGSTGSQYARASAEESFLEPSADLLSSDFLNHRRNLEFGRWCQDTAIGSFIYAPSVLQPPKFIQGPFYPDSLHRPINADIFSFSQILGNMQGSIPGTPLMQGYGPISGTFSGPRPGALSVGGDLRKSQTGTGTYLPLRHGSYKDVQLPGVRSQHAMYKPDQGRSGNMGSSSRRKGIGHRQNNTDEYTQAHVDVLNGIDRHITEGKLGNRNTWHKGHHLISPYPSVASSLAFPVSPQGPSNGFSGLNFFGNSSHDPGGVVTLPPSHSLGSVLPLGAGQLEFGSLGPVQIGSVPGELNLGHEFGTIHHGVSTTGGARSDGFPSIPDKDTKRSLPQRTGRTYQLREDDFPPLPLQGHQGGSSIKSNIDN